jgi:hypothetical protein
MADGRHPMCFAEKTELITTEYLITSKKKKSFDREGESKYCLEGISAPLNYPIDTRLDLGCFLSFDEVSAILARVKCPQSSKFNLRRSRRREITPRDKDCFLL